TLPSCSQRWRREALPPGSRLARGPAGGFVGELRRQARVRGPALQVDPIGCVDRVAFGVAGPCNQRIEGLADTASPFFVLLSGFLAIASLRSANLARITIARAATRRQVSMSPGTQAPRRG